MNVQNHRVMILKYHLTITHGTANTAYHSTSITVGPLAEGSNTGSFALDTMFDPPRERRNVFPSTSSPLVWRCIRSYRQYGTP